jgi:hypothetical protein
VVYWGTASGTYPDSEVVPGDTSTHKVAGLAANTKYYFVVTAIGVIDGEQAESRRSREVSWTKHDHFIDDERDAEWEITSGELNGFKIIYDSADSSGVTPTLGPSSEIPSLDLPGVNGIGFPLNLQPSPSTFGTPVKIFIPCPGYANVSNLNIYYYNGFDWVLANDSSEPDDVQPDAAGWMEPGARVNHNNGNPSTIEIQVYHFSGAQAGSTSGDGSGSFDIGAGGGCFVATVSSNSQSAERRAHSVKSK